jgi:predicted TIM-barrel fold metal-dependent hydrolase
MIYDAHCHIFTMEYAVLEVYAIIRDYLKGEYHFYWPHSSADKKNEHEYAVKQFLDLIMRLHELYIVLFDNEQDVYNLMLSINKAVNRDATDLVLAPLMMDIYYMFTKPYGCNDTEFHIQPKVADPEKEFLRIMKEIEFLISIVNSKNHMAFLRDVHENAKKKVLDSFTNSDENNKDLSPGFVEHMNALIALKATYGDMVFPFFAVDPRRNNIAEYVKSNVGYGKDFKGVKLYTRLGYYPDAEPLLDVYDYCEKNQIPVVNHTSLGGFPPFNNWAYEKMSDPAGFENVLKSHPDLYLNFAHYGNGNEAWENTITGYCNDYENVYTDVACYTNGNDLKRVLQNIQTGKIPQGKVMYGSDFDIMLLADGAESLEKYIHAFNTIVDKHNNITLYQDLTFNNPVRFLQPGN